MKKIICILLGLAFVLSLAACTAEVDLGQTEPTTKNVDQDDLNAALGQLGADSLDLALQEAMRKAMAQGVTFPAEDTPVETMAPPMPTGVPIRPEDVYPLMDKARAILDSKTYTVKARGSAPPTQGMPLGTTPITFAVDKNQSAFEAEMNWTNMMRAMSEPGSQEYNMAFINGATMTTFFGKKIRFITKPEGSMILFVEKNSYASIPNDEGGDSAAANPLSVEGMFGDALKPSTSGNVKASKVTDGGKEYLCAEIAGDTDGVTLLYYFNAPDGSLRRIEIKAKNPENGNMETMVLEIDLLSETVDPAMFSTAGFKAMSFDEMAQMGEGGFAGLFG